MYYIISYYLWDQMMLEYPAVFVHTQLQTTQLDISEGDTGRVYVVSSVPPRLFCPPIARDSCQVRILAQLRAAKDSRCPDGRVIPQVVQQSCEHLIIVNIVVGQ